jgi:peptidoglycan/LPS O-acetylase OafA/YrhL
VKQEKITGKYFYSVLDRAYNVLEDTYYIPHIRVLSFFSGILLGHIIEQSKDSAQLEDVKEVKKFIMKLLFGFSIFIVALLPLTLPIEKYLGILYGLSFIFANTFIIYACHSGYGGIVNDFLSSKFWIPISKMALSIYLFGIIAQGALTGSRLHPLTSLTTADVVRNLKHC